MNREELMKKLDVENKALNGRSFNEEISGLVSSVATPVKGLLVNNETKPETKILKEVKLKKDENK